MEISVGIVLAIAMLASATIIEHAIARSTPKLPLDRAEEHRQLQERFAVAQLAAILAAGDVHAGPNALVRAPGGDVTLGQLRDEVGSSRNSAQSQNVERAYDDLLARSDVFSRGCDKFVNLAWTIYDRVAQAQKYRSADEPMSVCPTPTGASWMTNHLVPMSAIIADEKKPQTQPPIRGSQASEPVSARSGG